MCVCLYYVDRARSPCSPSASPRLASPGQKDPPAQRIQASFFWGGGFLDEKKKISVVMSWPLRRRYTYFIDIVLSLQREGRSFPPSSLHPSEQEKNNKKKSGPTASFLPSFQSLTDLLHHNVVVGVVHVVLLGVRRDGVLVPAVQLVHQRLPLRLGPGVGVQGSEKG